jgi:IS4 transposase
MSKDEYDVWLVTDRLDLTAEVVALLYRYRWQIETSHSHYTSSSKDLFSDAWATLGLLSRQGQVAATAAAMAA